MDGLKLQVNVLYVKSPPCWTFASVSYSLVLLKCQDLRVCNFPIVLCFKYKRHAYKTRSTSIAVAHACPGLMRLCVKNKITSSVERAI